MTDYVDLKRGRVAGVKLVGCQYQVMAMWGHGFGPTAIARHLGISRNHERMVRRDLRGKYQTTDRGLRRIWLSHEDKMTWTS